MGAQRRDGLGHRCRRTTRLNADRSLTRPPRAVSPGAVPQLDTRLADLRKTARSLSRLWGVPRLAAGVTIEFSSRLSRSFGRSLPSRKIVRLNTDLASGRPALLREVFCHELAHVAAFELEGRGAHHHSPTWAALVVKAGYRPTTSLHVPHLRPAPKPARSRFEHTCPVCHSRRIAGRPVRRWRCARCVEVGLAGQFLIRRMGKR